MSIVCFCFLLGPALRSEAQVEGGITEISGKRITGALLLAYNKEGKLADSARSDKAGFFEFRNLVPGKYTIEITVAGYKPAKEEVEVSLPYKAGNGSRNDLSGATRLDVVLEKPK